VGELGGRIVGLVGYGAVPRILTPMLSALGARVLYTATARKPDAQAEWRDLDGLLAESDIVSLHLPHDDATGGLMDRAAFARMKPGAVFINTARGGLVDQAALVDALVDGRLLAAGLDVFDREPVPADCPLLALDNVVVQPHVAWLTQETLGRSLAVAMENCRRLRDGEDLLHRVS
jgi:phosphoglycerate dehydrogenase-like enzyme